MHLSKKALLHSLVVLSAFVLFLYVTSRVIIVDSFAVLEKQMMRDNVERVLNSLANEQQELLRTAYDWGVWDDTYAFMADGNRAFIEKNLLANTFSSLKLDVMAFVRPSGTVLFGKRYLPASGTLINLPDSLMPFFSAKGAFLDSRDPDKKAAGLILLPEGPMLVAARTIITSREEGPSRGIVVLGRFLDADAVKRLAATTRLSLAIERIDTPWGPNAIPGRPALSPASPIRVVTSGDRIVSGFGLVKDLKGNPALVVRVDAPRQIFLQGKETVRYFLAWIFVILLVFSVLSHLLFRKIVLSRESQRESEGRYRAVVQQASDAILLVDTGSKALLETNPAFSSLFGYKQEECRRLTLYDIMSGDPAECDRIIGMSLGSVNQPMPEVFCRRKNGMPMPMELAVSRIPSGRRELFSVILRDVTERRRAEEAVRTKEIVERSESRFRTMATHAPVGIFQTDVWGDCLFINETYTRLTGIGGREAVGKGWLLSIHPDDRDGVVSAWFEAVRGGNEFSLEYRFLPDDGEEVRVFASATPVRDENGRISGYIGTITDISELKKREVELKEQSSFLNAVIQRAAEGICVCHNITGHPYVEFTVWNDRMAEITGYPMAEINRRGWYQTLYPDPVVRKKVIARMEAMRRGEDLHGEEWKIARPDGEERVVLISTSIIKTVGEEVHVLAIIQDTTERKRMEEELVKGQKLESLGLLAGGIAHDFNNLLVGILGNISLARELVRPENRVCDKLKEAEKAAERAGELSRQLLTFARGGEPVKRTVYLQEIVLHGVRFALRGSNCRLECRLSDDLRPVDADEGQIGQVIGNIVLNAVQSMPSGGTLTVCTDNVDIPPGELPALSPGRYVRLSFADQGPGIHPDHLSRVFDPYFTTKEKGSGLGLTTAYSIVKHHGGCIIAESVVGSGTTFHVYLPASESRPIGGPVRQTVEPGSRRGRILLMDDEDIVREVACQMLTHLGYTVEVCADGAEAVALYRENFERGDCFDVVIMDLTIPGGMGGKEAMTELLALDPRARGIVSSGYAAEPVLARYGEYGFRGAVAKPYNMADLDEALRRALE